MWRLMFAMIVVSDSGSVAVDSNATNWPNQQVCQQMIETLYRTTATTSTVGGHKLTIKTHAICVPVRGNEDVGYAEPQPPPAYYAPPPPQPGFPGISIGPGGIRFGPRF